MSSELDLYSVKHLKLSTGEEVLAEIIEEDQWDVVMRRPLKLVTEIAKDRTRFHSFRCFMTYMDDPETFVILKSRQIVAVTFPVPSMLQQYCATIEEIEKGQDYSAQKEAAHIAKAMIDEIIENNRNRDDDDGNDSDGGNIIPFPTFH